MTADLTVKDRELRTLRLKKIFQSPQREDKNEEKDASFAPRLARSITKTSQELNR